VRLHIQESLDLTQGEVLAVALSNQLIESAQKLKGIAQDLTLIQTSTDAGDDLGEEV
jgi:hypothetical protein